MSVADKFLGTGTKLSLKRAVYNSWLRRPAGIKKRTAMANLSQEFKISVSTVQRYIREMQRYGEGGAPRRRTQGRTMYAWSEEALTFLRSIYLTSIRNVGDGTMRNAYRLTLREAQIHGWKVGSEPSAYKYLSNLSPALLDYANGGNLALDNKFWILRDLSLLRPFQVIVGDQHRFDFWCTDGSGGYFRPECYLWLDMRTRLVYGVAFDRHYNSSTVIRALRVGVEHFGMFESTYNDNGSSERSAWSDLVVQQLQSYGMRFGSDIADLYKDESSGQYLVRDDSGSIVAYADDAADWHRKNRRIFANVKNAKTKPIERFFSTLEQMLRDMCLPGFVKELNLSVPEEEEARRRLEWQKKNGYILTFQEFISAVAVALDQYNNRKHSSLGRSPLEELTLAEQNGFRRTMLNPADIEYCFFNRATAVVQGDRVRLMGRYFAGPPLTQDMVLNNRGSLVNLNKKKVELRFNPDNLESNVYAIDPRNGEPILLHEVKGIDMFDQQAFQEEIANKRRQMKAVTTAFRELTSNQKVLVDNRFSAPYLAAQDDAANMASLSRHAMPVDTPLPDGQSKRETESSIEEKLSQEMRSKPARQAVYTSPRDRYIALLKAQKNGVNINENDEEFMLEYEMNMDDDELFYISSIV